MITTDKNNKSYVTMVGEKTETEKNLQRADPLPTCKDGSVAGTNSLTGTNPQALYSQ